MSENTAMNQAPVENIIEMTNIVKKFYIGTPNELTILKGISITVKKGEFISIVGASGSGKSTLMNIIGALDHPTEGGYVLGGEDTSGMKGNRLSDIRNRKVGFVFQTFNLIPRTNALRNVELPMLYAGLSGSKRTRHAKELLELVGMGDRMRHLPNELSGGQKQRVAIARAMANNPDIILADEPTGALDTETGRLVMDLFHRLNAEQGRTVVLITHNPELAAETERVLTISDGMIIGEETNPAFVRGGRRKEDIHGVS
jgi:putative ABC transport system ATP-binding protein